MDNVSFDRAPVVELIAELRWTPPNVKSETSGQTVFATGTEIDEFFQRFGTEVHKAGFTQAEKVIPSGFPPILHQVTWRYRKPGVSSTLLQVGLGLFSANALQPYRRWKEFRPTVELGVDALLRTRLNGEKEQPFTGLSLRYVNAFCGDLLTGKQPAEFIRNVLGMKLELPNAVQRLVDPRRPANINARFLLPLADRSKLMSLVIGDGQVNAQPAAIFDITVAETTPVPPSLEKVIQTLTESRNIIHDCFIELTTPLVQLMQPRHDV